MMFWVLTKITYQLQADKGEDGISIDVLAGIRQDHALSMGG